VSAAPRVVAAILTRDRRELLRQSLDAVLAQTRPVDRIVVVDNASSDGTREMLDADYGSLRVVALPENQGATGGFHEAIGAAMEEGGDWLWLLDDDSIARPSALEELLRGIDALGPDERPALVCSRVVWTDGNPHVMNRPVVRGRPAQQLTDTVRRGLLPVRAASWVSVMIARDAVERSGMPLRHFFYQADDIEYTARLLRGARGYLVPASVVEHRTANMHTAVDDDHRFYYHARNTVLMLRGRKAWAAREKPTLAWFLVTTSVAYLRLNRLSPASVRNLAAALLDGLRADAH
jgi:GT2 family glycosyltransferase